MVATIDGWLPLDHRDALRAIATEINQALAGFIRGQSLVCLFLGLWYGVGLTLIGLDFGFLIGVIAGVLSFIPYIGSLTALVLSIGVSLVQGWPSLTLFLSALGGRAGRPVPRGQRHLAQAGRRIDRAASGMADVRAVRVRRIVRLHRPVDRGADGGGAGRSRPPPDRPLSQEPALSRRTQDRRRRRDRAAASARPRLAARAELRARGLPRGAGQRPGAEDHPRLARLADAGR